MGSQTDLRGGTKVRAKEGCVKFDISFRQWDSTGSARRDPAVPVAVQIKPSLACLKSGFVCFGQPLLRKMDREISPWSRGW